MVHNGMLMLHIKVITVHALNNVFKWSFIIVAAAMLVLSVSVLMTWLLIEMLALLAGVSI